MGCSCKANREECFCRNRKCVEKKWECHVDQDCVNLEKCKDGACSCQENTCEFECRTVADCEGFTCSDALGYQCKCEKFLCQFEKKFECKEVSECWSKGLCSETEPCECRNDVCTKPWWYHGKNKSHNCRNDEDCEMIRSCTGISVCAEMSKTFLNMKKEE